MTGRTTAAVRLDEREAAKLAAHAARAKASRAEGARKPSAGGATKRESAGQAVRSRSVEQRSGVATQRRPENRTKLRAADGKVLLAAPPVVSTAPRTPFVVLILTLLAGGLVALLLLNTSVNENAFQLQALRRNQRVLTVQEQQLKGELARLEAPGTIAATARRLGLVPAGAPAFIRLPDGKILGVPAPATVASDQSSSGSGGGTPKPKPSGDASGQTGQGTSAGQGTPRNQSNPRNQGTATDQGATGQGTVTNQGAQAEQGNGADGATGGTR